MTDRRPPRSGGCRKMRFSSGLISGVTTPEKWLRDRRTLLWQFAAIFYITGDSAADIVRCDFYSSKPEKPL
jgi:hypothetical protein